MISLIRMITVSDRSVVYHWGVKGGLTALCGKSAGVTAFNGDRKQIRRSHEGCRACARRIREGDLT